MRLPAARLAQELRRKYDVSPRELLWEAQVALAKSILAEEPDLPLKEVAARSGVSGVRNLHRIFKRVEGVAPGAARMRLS